MKLENQVTSLEISKRLKELGVKQESYFWLNGNQEWIDKEVNQMGGGIFIVKVIDDKLHYEISHCESQSPACKESYSAFTVAELGEMLPWKIGSYQLNSRKNDLNGKGWDVQYLHEDEDTVMIHDDSQTWESADTEADARGKMLIYLLENNLLTV